jgi:hypothetical protein
MAMSLQLKICRDSWETWSVHGLSPVPVSNLPSLSAGIDYARAACEAAPATIELVVDGMYIVVHQEHGWPRSLVASETELTRSAPAEPDLSSAASWRHRFAWFGRLWYSGVKGSVAGSGERSNIGGAGLRLG